MAYSGLNSTFTDALMNLRRRATLQGRPTTQAETAGVVEGMASSASERLARAKAAQQAQEQLGLQRDTLNLQREDMQRQADIAAKQMRQEKYKNYATTGLIGLGVANEALRPTVVRAGTQAVQSPLAEGASALWSQIKGILGF